MIKNLLRRISCILVFQAVIALSPPLGATTISIEPATKLISLGQVFSLDIVISDVIDLFSYQFDLAFDPSVLSASSIDEGSFLSSGGNTFFLPGIIDNISGTISFTADSLLGSISGVTGSGILANITFSALMVSESPISLFNSILVDSNFLDIALDSQSGGTVTVQQGAPVPEPCTLFLFGAGLLGMFPLRRRTPPLCGEHAKPGGS